MLLLCLRTSIIYAAFIREELLLFKFVQFLNAAAMIDVRVGEQCCNKLLKCLDK